jgi:hypothetical protein
MDKKMKTNQDGGGESSTAPAKELKANQKGAAKYKGAHDYDTSKGSHDHPHGAAKMGYSQSFGAARMNGYAKGAAKVASVMSFGASKYMKHGAADTGHGGPEGHTHPTKTITSRNTSGGGSTSSSSNSTGGGSSSSTQSATTTNAGSPEFNKAFANARKSGVSAFDFNGKSYNTNLASDETSKAANAANVTSSNSSSNNTSGGSSTTTSNTITSPNSMAETLLQANIANENRKQTLNFDREEAQIAAGNDSIRKANQTLDKMPRFHQLTEAGQAAAGRAGGRAAATSRRNSNLFSREEINTMYRDGQNKQ